MGKRINYSPGRTTFSLLWLSLSALAQVNQTHPLSFGLEFPSLPNPIAITRDGAGRIYLTGNFFSDDPFPPIMPGGYQTLGDPRSARSYVALLRPEGDQFFWVTRLNMVVQAIASGADGEVIAAGVWASSNCPNSASPEGRVAVIRLSPDGRSIRGSLCLGAYDLSSLEEGEVVGLAVDAQGRIFVAANRVFVGTGLQPAMLWRLDPGATTIQSSITIPFTRIESLTLDRGGQPVVGGSIIESFQLPAIVGAAQSRPGGSSVLRSEDAGASFQSTAALPGPVADVAVARRNANRVVAWSPFFVALSSDAGRSWTMLPEPVPGDRVAALDDDGTLYLLVSRFGPPVLYRWDNTAWTTLSYPESLGFALSSSSGTIVAGAGKVYLGNGPHAVSADAGRTWRMLPPSPYAFGTVRLDPAEGRILYRSSDRGPSSRFERSEDGERWETIQTPVPNGVLDLHPTRPGVVYFRNQRMYRSTDGGRNWQEIGPAPEEMVQLHPVRTDAVLTRLTIPFSRQLALLPFGASAAPELFAPSLNFEGRAMLTGAVRNSPVNPDQWFALRTPSTDGCVCKLDADLTRFAFCTYAGGLGLDTVLSTAVDQDNRIWAAGRTNSQQLPTTPNAFQPAYIPPEPSEGPVAKDDLFLTAINPTGRNFDGFSYLGTAQNETLLSFFLEQDKFPVVFGYTSSRQFPLTPEGSGPQTAPGRPSYFYWRGTQDISGALLSSYFTDFGSASSLNRPRAVSNGNGGLIAVTGQGRIYPDPILVPGGVVSAPPGFGGSLLLWPHPSRESPREHFALRGVLAPGRQMASAGLPVALFARGPETEVRAEGFALPTELGGARVLFNGGPAAMLYAGPDRFHFQIPWTAPAGVHTLQLQQGETTSVEFPIWVFAARPVLLTDERTGSAMAYNEDGALNSASRPAAAGSKLRLLIFGYGPLTEAPPPGETPTGRIPAAATATVRIGQTSATVLYLGTSEGLAAGGELELLVPADLRAGTYSVQVSIEGVISNQVVVYTGAAP